MTLLFSILTREKALIGFFFLLIIIMNAKFICTISGQDRLKNILEAANILPNMHCRKVEIEGSFAPWQDTAILS